MFLPITEFPVTKRKTEKVKYKKVKTDRRVQTECKELKSHDASWGKFVKESNCTPATFPRLDKDEEGRSLRGRPCVWRHLPHLTAACGADAVR